MNGWFIATVAVLSAVWATLALRTARVRWGVVFEHLRGQGEGAFRSGGLTRPRLRGIPTPVLLAGPFGWVLGMTAPWVCVSITLDHMLAAITHPYASFPPLLWFAGFTALLLAGQCLFLLRALHGVMRCTRGAGETAAKTGNLGVVIQTLALIGILTTEAPASIEVELALALTGLLVIANMALVHAGHAVASVQDQMTDDEWYALPGSPEG